METTSSSAVIAAFAVVLGLAAAPAPAQAQVGYEVGTAAAVTVLVIGIPSVGFVIGDIVSFSLGTPFDTGWAVVETVLAGINLITGGILFAIGAAEVTSLGNGVTLAYSIAPLAIGTFNLVHAIWSFTSLGERDAPVSRFTPYVAPDRDGFHLGVAGIF